MAANVVKTFADAEGDYDIRFGYRSFIFARQIFVSESFPPHNSRILVSQEEFCRLASLS